VTPHSDQTHRQGPGDSPATPSGKTLAVATGGAVAVAALLLVSVVLPAEYGLDPMGTGRLLGLLGLSRAQPVVRSDDAYRTDVAEFELAPTEWVESTYRFEDGESMVFAWDATGAVSYNFHSAPDGAPPGFAESFDAQERESAYGTYTAPFSGIHGWYWENLGTEYVTITLTTAGYYTEARTARDRVGGERPLRDPKGRVLRRE
jgi:hypothetical protein